MSIDRRTALALLGCGVLSSRLNSAAQHLHGLKTGTKPYTLQFFTGAENQLLDTIAEMILPADEHSPGAHAAKVSLYIDLVVATSSLQVQQRWKSRLTAFDALARQRYQASFLELDSAGRRQLLEEAAARELQPETPAEHFFTDMKRITVFAYYSSEIGLLRDLGYQGNMVMKEFPGCK